MTPRPSRRRMLAGAAAIVAVPQVVRAQALQKIQFTGVPTDDLTPVYYAIKNGLYQKAGLDVEFVPAIERDGGDPGGRLRHVRDREGQLDRVARRASARASRSRSSANGAMWDPKKPFTLTLVAADSPIKTAPTSTARSLAQRRAQRYRAAGVMAWVDKNGGDSKTLKWVEIPNSAPAAALAEHRVDGCTMLNEPAVIGALASGKMRVLGAGVQRDRRALRARRSTSRTPTGCQGDADARANVRRASPTRRRRTRTRIRPRRRR